MVKPMSFKWKMLYMNLGILSMAMWAPKRTGALQGFHLIKIVDLPTGL